MSNFAFCKVTLSPVRSENRDSSEMVSQLLFGEPIEILEVQNKWTRIKTFYDKYEGWIDTKHFLYLTEKEMNEWNKINNLSVQLTLEIISPWGLQNVVKGSYLPLNLSQIFSIGKYYFEFDYSQNEIEFTLSEFAKSYLNAPYLWGGKSPFGIDCSGLTQKIFEFYGINLPRDAYQQAECGQEISFSNRKEKDLAFFKNENGKIIHVGFLLEDLRIIHASSWVKIDVLKNDGIYCSKTNEKTHHLKKIVRIL